MNKNDVSVFLLVGACVFGNFGVLLFPLTPWILVAGILFGAGYVGMGIISKKEEK